MKISLNARDKGSLGLSKKVIHNLILVHCLPFMAGVKLGLIENGKKTKPQCGNRLPKVKTTIFILLYRLSS